MVVLLTHICETFRLIPQMHWGAERSAGHYLDFVSAVLGLTFFPIGHLSHALKKRRAQSILRKAQLTGRVSSYEGDIDCEWLNGRGGRTMLAENSARDGNSECCRVALDRANIGSNDPTHR